MQNRLFQKGPGWRIGWKPEALDFPGLVGADTWALELTREELVDFCRLSLELASTLESMADLLMAEERICCELESDRLWLEVEGLADTYELRLMLKSGRRGEGSWSEAAVDPLMQAVRTLNMRLA